MKKLLLVTIFLIIGITALTAPIKKPPRDLYKGLMREAVGDGPRGLYAVACVVRNRLNRGMDHGLVGLRRRGLDKFVAKHSAKHIARAKRAVYRVFEEGSPDITGGAIYFENIEYFGKPKWCKHKTVKIGHHTFYK